ncbi:MAG: hypothetical protein H0U59_12350 [Gemmatimonadaceae bacterium]|nr:hypothetical protein [Gemmatimonadaceae bacterium]
MSTAPRVRPGLLRHPLDSQVLVYDPRDEQVHLLDPTTACVLELLESGRYPLDKMPREVARRNNVPADPGLVALAVEELRRAGLLDESASPVAPLVDVSRRDLVRKLAMTGAAALLVPAVATLTATHGYAQSSIGGGVGDACTVNTQCASGLICCGTGFCAATCNVGPDGPCAGNFQCTSGKCCSGKCAVFDCGSVGACGACNTDGECNTGLCGQACGGTGIGNDRNKKPNGAACNGEGECCSNKCSNQPGQGGGVCFG